MHVFHPVITVCPLCHAGNDVLDHIVQCPTLRAASIATTAHLHLIHGRLALTTSTLLGAVDEDNLLTLDDRIRILDATSTFIRQVLGHRYL